VEREWVSQISIPLCAAYAPLMRRSHENSGTPRRRAQRLSIQHHFKFLPKASKFTEQHIKL